jgi:hypothetical protein
MRVRAVASHSRVPCLLGLAVALLVAACSPAAAPAPASSAQPAASAPAPAATPVPEKVRAVSPAATYRST